MKQPTTISKAMRRGIRLTHAAEPGQTAYWNGNILCCCPLAAILVGYEPTLAIPVSPRRQRMNQGEPWNVDWVEQRLLNNHGIDIQSLEIPKFENEAPAEFSLEIMHLYDHHYWGRERIARYIADHEPSLRLS